MLKCLWWRKEIQIWPTLLNIKMLDQKWIFWVSSPTLLADVCDVRVCYRLMVVVVKAMHRANMHNILLESLLSDVLMWLNYSELWWTHKLLMLWLLILRVLVFSELSAALLVIKWTSFRCITFLNDIKLWCKKMNEMRSYIKNWQT